MSGTASSKQDACSHVGAEASTLHASVGSGSSKSDAEPSHPGAALDSEEGHPTQGEHFCRMPRR